MTGHTPGPWEIRRETRNEPTMPFGKFQEVKKLIVGSGQGTFDDPFHIVHETYDNGETEPDARLIAAAPDLLEALRVAWRCLETGEWCDPEKSRIIQAAIAKATER